MSYFVCVISYIVPDSKYPTIVLYLRAAIASFAVFGALKNMIFAVFFSIAMHFRITLPEVN